MPTDATMLAAVAHVMSAQAAQGGRGVPEFQASASVYPRGASAPGWWEGSGPAVTWGKSQAASVFHGAPSVVLSALSCLPVLHPFCRRCVKMLMGDKALLVVTARPLVPESKAVSLLLGAPLNCF